MRHKRGFEGIVDLDFRFVAAAQFGASKNGNCLNFGAAATHFIQCNFCGNCCDGIVR